MFRILIPVDGASAAERALRYAMRWDAECHALELHVVNVQEPITAWGARRSLRDEEIEGMQMSHGGDVLRTARALLDGAGLRYVAQVLVGPVAQTIVDYAKKQACDQIIMGARGLGAIQGLLLGSVATKAVHLSEVPVTLVK